MERVQQGASSSPGDPALHFKSALIQRFPYHLFEYFPLREDGNKHSIGQSQTLRELLIEFTLNIHIQYPTSIVLHQWKCSTDTYKTVKLFFFKKGCSYWQKLEQEIKIYSVFSQTSRKHACLINKHWYLHHRFRFWFWYVIIAVFPAAVPLRCWPPVTFSDLPCSRKRQTISHLCVRLWGVVGSLTSSVVFTGAELNQHSWLW